MAAVQKGNLSVTELQLLVFLLHARVQTTVVLKLIEEQKIRRNITARIQSIIIGS